MVTFDTLAYSKRLQSGGFTTLQAETQVEILKEFVENHLATQEDIRDLKKDVKAVDVKVEITKNELNAKIESTKNELNAKIEATKHELKRDIQELEIRLKHDLTLRLGGMLAVGIGAVATLVKLL